MDIILGKPTVAPRNQSESKGGLNRNQKKVRATTEQLQCFADFCQQNPDLSTSKTRTSIMQQALWSECAKRLNAKKGPTRSADKWRESLSGWKKQLRYRTRKINSEIVASGGDTSKLREFEKIALNTFDNVIAVRHSPRVAPSVPAVEETEHLYYADDGGDGIMELFSTERSQSRSGFSKVDLESQAKLDSFEAHLFNSCGSSSSVQSSSTPAQTIDKRKSTSIRNNDFENEQNSAAKREQTVAKREEVAAKREEVAANREEAAARREEAAAKREEAAAKREEAAAKREEAAAKREQAAAKREELAAEVLQQMTATFTKLQQNLNDASHKLDTKKT